MNNLNIAIIVRLLIVIATPFLLTMGTLRLLISWNAPSYPTFEYARIAPDRFGFTLEERLDLAHATLDYLRRSEPAVEAIHLLEELRMPGTDLPLYNNSEIGHMLDVKRVSDTFRRLTNILALLVGGGFIFLLARPNSRTEGYRAMFHGGIFTSGLVLVALVLIFISWNLVFTQFHELLFPPDTWTFYLTDSLIRLFPEQFWFDFGVIWTGAILLEGILLALIGYLLLRK